MAKIRRLGGFTDATVQAFVSPADELRARGKLGPYGEPTQPAEVDLEEDWWPGNSSETSPAKAPKSDGPTKPSRPKRARTTAGRSASTEASTTAQTGITSGPAMGA